MAGNSAPREQWASSIGFILAAAGSAVGLGNIWKFPFIAGMYGGAAFVIFYLMSIMIIGFPVMLIELSIGRRTQLNPVGAFKTLSPNRPYFIIGVMGVLVGFIILSYYSVVAGWTIFYIYKAAVGGFKGFSSPEVAGEHFNVFVANPYLPLIAHAIFMFLCIFVVVRGVKSGIEKGNRILMPTLFIIILLLVGRGMTLPGASKGISFLFAPDFSKLTPDAMLVAVGHAFFTLSLGMGAMLTYGSYLSKNENIIKSALWIVVTDTLVALLAGVAIFTAVFAMGFEPGAGPGLVFHVLPAIFAVMPGGFFVGILFFLLLSIAALTSGISLLEVVVAYFVDQRQMSRHKATVFVGILIFLLGVPSALSFGVLGNIKLFDMILFDFFDFLSFKYIMPLGGLFMVLYTMFVWKPVNFLQELRTGGYSLRIPELAVMIILAVAAIFVAVAFISGLQGKL